MQLIRKHPLISVIVAAVAILAVVFGVGALRAQERVRVEIGKRIFCVYGELLRSDVKPLWVARSEAAKYRVAIERILCDRHRKAQESYQRGQALAAKGKYSQALKAFRKAAGYDPKFKDVSVWVASGGKHGGTSTSSGSSSSGSSAGGTTSSGGTGSSGGTSGGSSSLAAMLPASIPGYSAGSIGRQPSYVERAYIPSDRRVVSSLIIHIYDRGSAANAARFIRRTSRRVYSENPRTIAFRGINAYFGTQSSTFATFAWAKGHVVRELLMTSSTGQPVELYGRITQIAQRVR